MSRSLVILLAAALAGLLWLRHENDNLSRALEKANRVAAEQTLTTGRLQQQLSVVISRADKNERAQVTLRETLNAAGERAARREKIITRLLNENETLRHWYSADLPDAVRRLHRRPACASAGDCPERLPESQSLPDAGQRPQN